MPWIAFTQDFDFRPPEKRRVCIAYKSGMVLFVRARRKQSRRGEPCKLRGRNPVSEQPAPEARKALEDLVYWAEGGSPTTSHRPVVDALLAAGVTFDVDKVRAEAARLEREYDEDRQRLKTAELARKGR